MMRDTLGERYAGMTPEQEDAFDAHEAWHKAAYAEIIKAGADEIGAALTTLAIFQHAFARGLQKLGPDWIAAQLQAMPSVPTVWPGGETTHPYSTSPRPCGRVVQSSVIGIARCW